jgi:hypothetical protein
MSYDRVTKLSSRAATKGAANDHVSEESGADQEYFAGLSDEDDTLDRDAAMSSPLKGSQLRAEAKVCLSHHRSAFR